MTSSNDDSNPQQGSDVSMAETSNSTQGLKLFVGGLPFDVRDEEFREAFASIGSLTAWEVVRSRSGRPRGFGFVTFEDALVAKKLLMTDNGEKAIPGQLLCTRMKVRGVTVEVKEATPKPWGSRPPICQEQGKGEIPTYPPSQISAAFGDPIIHFAATFPSGYIPSVPFHPFYPFYPLYCPYYQLMTQVPPNHKPERIYAADLSR